MKYLVFNAKESQGSWNIGKALQPKIRSRPQHSLNSCIQAQISLVTVIATGQPYDVGRTMRLPARTRFYTETTDD
jgi:hypothetical protein